MKSKNTLFRHFMLMASFLLVGGILFSACKKDPDPAPAATLAISSVSPGSGKAGDVVTINGTGFSSTPASNSVTFGTTPATVLAATPTALVVSVPSGISGNFTISVAQTGMTTAASPAQFNVTTTLTKPQITKTGSITASESWTADNIYILTNTVYVRSGVTVTIAPGTIIRGDKITKGTLIFEPGSKINAQGTAAAPIVFTSNQPVGLRNLGDWGGLVITGKADHNLATGVTTAAGLPVVEGGPTTQVSAIDGARDNNDNSGVLSYVRIEFAGVALSPNNEINGLSLYAVGAGTKIDHVQVSYANDDSIEWFGGTVSMNYLIAYRGIDDDFDTDNGYSGNVQFGLSVRDLTIADQSGSKGFESDNSGVGAFTQTPQTAVVFSNMTLVGPTATTTGGASLSTTANPSNAAASANYVSGVHIRRNSALSMFNSLVLGWPAGVLIDNSLTAANLAAGRSVLANNIVGGNLVGTVNGVASQNRDILYLSSAGAGSLTPINALGPDSSAFGTAVGPITYFSKNSNRRLAGTAAFLLTNAFTASGTKPDVTPATGSPALTGAAYTNAKLAPAFFDKTPTFIGAVSADKNFTNETWVNFDPNNAVYQ